VLLRSLSFMAINPLMRPSRSHLQKTIQNLEGQVNYLFLKRLFFLVHKHRDCWL